MANWKVNWSRCHWNRYFMYCTFKTN